MNYRLNGISGTTWVQYIIQLLEQECGKQHSTARNLEDEFPYLEYIYPGVEDIKARKGPRHIKTHLPYELMPSDIHRGKGKVSMWILLCYSVNLPPRQFDHCGLSHTAEYI